MSTKKMMTKRQKQIVTGLEQLEFAIRKVTCNVCHTEHVGYPAMLLGILAGTVNWEVRNAKEIATREDLTFVVDRVRRAFGTRANWGIGTPIADALRLIYGR